MDWKRFSLTTVLLCLAAPTALAVEVADSETTKELDRALRLVMIAAGSGVTVPEVPLTERPTEPVEKRLAAIEPTAPLGLLLGEVRPNAADTEPNNSCATASSWPAGATSGSATGTLTAGTDTNDYSRFEALRTERITVSEDPPAGADYDLELYDPSCVFRAFSDNIGSGKDTISHFDSDSNGFWRERVYYFSGVSGTYTVTYALGQNDAGSLADAPNSFGAGVLLTGTGSGSVGRAGDLDDWYHINVPALTRLTVTVLPDCYGGFDADVSLYNAGGGFLDSSAAGGCAADSVSCETTFGSTVSLDVNAFSGKGGYTVIASLGLPTLSGPAC